MTMKAEIGVTHLHAKDGRQTLEARRGKEGFSPMGFRGSMALLAL